MRRSRLCRSPLHLAVVALAAACAGGSEAEGTLATELPLLTLTEPLLEIGVLDGPDEYIFARIESVVRLGDGTIAVSDAGATRISLYDAEGTFIRRWGRQGDGPDEFRNLSRIYPRGPDSLLVSERYSARMSVFQRDGSLARRFPAVELTRDTLFALDSWLYGRFWVDGALLPDERAGVRAALDRLPQPRHDPGYRAVFADGERRLWIREPGAAATRLWTRTAGGGRPTAIVEIPSGFRPTHIEGEELLGVWSGESDVHFVRAYGLVDTGETAPTPAWLLGQEEAVTSEAPPDEEALDDLMRSAIRGMAGAQERHYSSNGSYTSHIDALVRLEKPEGIGVDFAGATTRGWAAVFTHPSIDRLCGLAYGFDSPPGWTSGMIVCGPYAGEATAGES